MPSYLPPSLLAATLLAASACESRKEAAPDAAKQHDAEAQQEVDASNPGASASGHDPGASGHDARMADDPGESHHDPDGSIEDAASGRDAEPAVSRDAGRPSPTLEELMQAYRAFSPHPSEPQAISAQIASLCRLPTAAENAFVASEHGTDFRLLQNWLNPAAKRGFDEKRTPFEVGAAIVKEKLQLESNGEQRLVARGLMIKRGPGFDPAHGDWEFGYWEPGKELRRGDQAARTCGGCHASAGTDFVFLDGRWRLPP